MKALVSTFNQEKALVGAFSMIVKIDCETDGSFYSTICKVGAGRGGDQRALNTANECVLSSAKPHNRQTQTLVIYTFHFSSYHLHACILLSSACGGHWPFHHNTYQS